MNSIVHVFIFIMIIETMHYFTNYSAIIFSDMLVQFTVTVCSV